MQGVGAVCEETLLPKAGHCSRKGDTWPQTRSQEQWLWKQSGNNAVSEFSCYDSLKPFL